MILTGTLLTVQWLNLLLLLLLAVIFIAAVFHLSPGWRESASQRRHRRYRAQAQRVLDRLPQLAGDARRLSWLRKINPYVFEELLLLACERRGYAVIRNTAYSGDGGLDGQVFIAGKRYLIQAKRYSRTIAPSHIQDFGELLRRSGCDGFFIHTGRTGNLSRMLLRACPQIHLVSGRKLLALLAGEGGWYTAGRPADGANND